MADLLKNAKQFSKDLYKDAVHFPRTTASWPAFKQSVIELFNETKSDLFFFRKDSLNPVLSDVAGRIDTTLKSDHSMEKAETLLSLKTETADKLSAVGFGQHKKFITATLLTLAGSLLVAAPLLGATACGVVLVTGVAAGAKYLSNEGAVINKIHPLMDRIDREIVGMASGEGRAALFSSPAFQQKLIDKGVLKKVFTGAGWGASKDADYDRVVAKAVTTAKSEAPQAPQA
jgi:hypothetical protein